MPLASSPGQLWAPCRTQPGEEGVRRHRKQPPACLSASRSRSVSGIKPFEGGVGFGKFVDVKGEDLAKLTDDVDNGERMIRSATMESHDDDMRPMRASTRVFA